MGSCLVLGIAWVAIASSAEAQVPSWMKWSKDNSEKATPAGELPADPFLRRNTASAPVTNQSMPAYQVAERPATNRQGNAQYGASGTQNPNAWPPSPQSTQGPYATTQPSARPYYGATATPVARTQAPSPSPVTYPTTDQSTPAWGFGPQGDQRTPPTTASNFTPPSAEQSGSVYSQLSNPRGEVPRTAMRNDPRDEAVSPQRIPGKNPDISPRSATPSYGTGGANRLSEEPGDNRFRPAEIIALVNGTPILAGDILGVVNETIQARLADVPEEQRSQISAEELKAFQAQAFRDMLPNFIETKMVYLDFMRNIPSDRHEEMQERLDEQYGKLQLDKDMEAAGVNSPAEFDMQLRTIGSSLEKKRRQFLERTIATEQIRTHAKINDEVTHQEMLDYYQDNLEDYRNPARSRWEQLMVSFEKCPNRDEAWQQIVAMGNEVLRGAPLESVAKRSSHDLRADEGGQHDWTSKNSLRYESIDKAIFSLPVGELSEIIESEQGLHIIRVLEREGDTVTPFSEVQNKIKEKIKNDRFKQEVQKYLTEVKRRTQVWTVFDGPLAEDASVEKTP